MAITNEPMSNIVCKLTLTNMMTVPNFEVICKEFNVENSGKVYLMNSTLNSLFDFKVRVLMATK
jgi:hypothetical protein